MLLAAGHVCLGLAALPAAPRLETKGWALSSAVGALEGNVGSGHSSGWMGQFPSMAWGAFFHIYSSVSCKVE